VEITLYVRTYPVKGAPVSLSLFPCPPRQRHTFTSEGKVYEAVHRQRQVVVPDGAVVDADRKLLTWAGDAGRVQSTAAEVLALAEEKLSGFCTAS
jgi:hypothetical protein